MNESLDLFRGKLEAFEEQMLDEHSLESGELRSALKSLGLELAATPDLVFLLEDQEIGTLARASMLLTGVKAELEAKVKPKKRKAAAVTKKDKPAEILDDDEILF